MNVFNIESSKGWFYDTQELLKKCSNEILFYWVEDHICMDLNYFDLVVADMGEYNIDYVQYSFWLNGLLLEQFSNVEKKESDNLYFLEHDYISHKTYTKRYINTLVGIYSTRFFSKIISSKSFVKLWRAEVPFDFERPSWDTSILPFKRGIPKKEIFASIDDCQDVTGSSLISRGLYKSTAGRISSAYPSETLTMKILRVTRKALKPLRKFYLFLRSLSKTPLNFHLDFINSIYFPGKRTTAKLPQMNYNQINYLVNEIDLEGKKIFEYGSGVSTRFWTGFGAQEVVSIEYDEDQYSDNYEELSQVCTYVLVEPKVFDSVDSPNIYKSDVYKGYSFENYVNYINRYPEDYFDLIIIDGRARNACLDNCINKLKQGGLLILNNSNRNRYANAVLKLKKWQRKYYYGSVRGLLNLEESVVLFKK
jgi:precorrin-6B methylase 2